MPSVVVNFGCRKFSNFHRVAVVPFFFSPNVWYKYCPSGNRNLVRVFILPRGYILLHPPAEPPVETGMPLKRTVAPPTYATLTEEEKTV